MFSECSAHIIYYKDMELTHLVSSFCFSPGTNTFVTWIIYKAHVSSSTFLPCYQLWDSLSTACMRICTRCKFIFLTHLKKLEKNVFSNPSDSLRTISHVSLGTAKNKQISKEFNLKYKAVYRIICEYAVGWRDGGREKRNPSQ